jgi:hypothetical protein
VVVVTKGVYWDTERGYCTQVLAAKGERGYILQREALLGPIPRSFRGSTLLLVIERTGGRDSIRVLMQ